MSGLTIKQRAKVNAALCIIHDRGGDANAVTELARTIMATGHDARTAYERALNQFADANPEAGTVIGRMANLIEASCPNTVAQYDQALSQYIDRGDNSALTALAPMIAQDSAALAVQSGEMTPEEAAEGNLAKALGFTPSPDFEQAAAVTQQTAQAETSASFAFLSAPQDQGRSISAQVSWAGEGPGMVAPKAAQDWGQRSVRQGFAETTAPHGLRLPSAQEAGLPDVTS